MNDPYAVAANFLEALINDEFEAEGFTVVHDRIHESVGHEGTRIGVSPVDQQPQGGNVIVLDTTILVQFYSKYKLEVDPNQKVDPRKITGYAHRFLEAVEKWKAPTPSSEVWFFMVTGISYPSDPTGNKSRFEATVLAKGENAGLVETTG